MYRNDTGRVLKSRNGASRLAVVPQLKRQTNKPETRKVMYPLETIKSINSRPPRIKDNFNRECSAITSRGGFVVHSGVHRSTAFIHPSICGDTFFAAQYWLKQEQSAIDAFITAIVGGTSLASSERAAFVASRPGWQCREVKAAGASKSTCLQAEKPSGRLTRLEGASTWQELHNRTK